MSQGRELVLTNPVVPGREACHADPNRARPPLPGAPVAGDVFAHSEYAVGRAGCTGARLVGKVKDHCVLGEWFEIAARMTRRPPQWSVRGRPCLWNRGLLPKDPGLRFCVEFEGKGQNGFEARRLAVSGIPSWWMIATWGARIRLRLHR